MNNKFELNHFFYKNFYDDLINLNNNQLEEHYNKYGKKYC